VHVRRLRAKLGPEHEALIGTVRNVGYRFVPLKGSGEDSRRGSRRDAGVAQGEQPDGEHPDGEQPDGEQPNREQPAAGVAGGRRAASRNGTGHDPAAASPVTTRARVPGPAGEG
jgi:hypothetical protein